MGKMDIILCLDFNMNKISLCVIYSSRLYHKVTAISWMSEIFPCPSPEHTGKNIILFC